MTQMIQINRPKKIGESEYRAKNDKNITYLENGATRPVNFRLFSIVCFWFKIENPGIAASRFDSQCFFGRDFGHSREPDSGGYR